jgi:hypothetical protein
MSKEFEQTLLDFEQAETKQPEVVNRPVFEALARAVPATDALPLSDQLQANREAFMKNRGRIRVPVQPLFHDAHVQAVPSRTPGAGTLTWSVPRNTDTHLTDEQMRDSAVLSYSGTRRFQRKLDEETDLINGYYGRHGIIEPEYNLLEPYTVIDCESFLARALERKHSLMFRNGFQFTGDNQTFVDYVERRAQQIGYVTGTSFENLLKDIVWNLLVCSNVILIKVRDHDASGGRAGEKNGNKPPVAGYQICPPHTIFPYLDGFGHIGKWRRFFGDGRRWRDYAVEDVVHFWWNKKPGHVFGTPRIVSVRDDIFALRRLEENIELLLVHHLFPLMHLKVGTEKSPCEYYPDGSSEIAMYQGYIENMPKEGVLITDERVEVDVQGIGKEGADFAPVLQHYKQRIFTGLGVSGLDLGETDTATRSTAENVSQNLKDQIKSDLQWFCNQVSMLVLREWFQEAPFALSVQNAVADVQLTFHELDPDSQIKTETHHLNLFNNHAITHAELRKRLKHKPLEEKEHSDTHFGRHVLALEKFKLNGQMKLAEMNNEHQAKLAVHQAAATKKTKVTHKSATGSSRTKETVEPTAHAKKAVQTLLQPVNQHGRNLDPHKARSSRALAGLIYDELMAGFQDLEASNDLGFSEWREASDSILDGMFPDVADHPFRDRLKGMVANTVNADMIWALVHSEASRLLESGSAAEEVPGA